MACVVWIARSRVAVRGVQDAVVPQQGHVPGLQQVEGREARRVHQRVVADGGLATTGRRILQTFCSPWEQAERGSPGSFIGSSARTAELTDCS